MLDKIYDGIKTPETKFDGYKISHTIYLKFLIGMNKKLSVMSEQKVGDIISNPEIERNALFITAIIWIESNNIDIISWVNDSLKRMKTNYFDLLLVYDTNNKKDEFLPILKEMEECGIINSFKIF